MGLWFILVLALEGLIVGALARLALPGPDPMGILATIGLGLAGSFVGGILSWPGPGPAGGPVASTPGATLPLYLHPPSVPHRPLTRPGPPGLSDEVVVEHGNTQRSLLSSTEPFGCALELCSAERAALVPKRARRVEPDDVEPGQRGCRLRRLPDPLELRPRAHEARRRVR